MNPTTLSRLVDLNRQFYQTFAVPFSLTRQRLQPGVRHLLERVDTGDSLLDLGCGNGELAKTLAHRGHTGGYMGVDFSAPLIAQANPHLPDNFRFIQADLSAKHWGASLAGDHYDVIVLFAVLHHIPGNELRLQLLREVRKLIEPDGYFFHSEWQFLNSPRLAARVQPWESAGMSPADVDSGDYLLDWRHGGQGLRYVHHFSEPELEELASQSGFKVIESFYSDGENGRLGLYQVWCVAQG